MSESESWWAARKERYGEWVASQPEWEPGIGGVYLLLIIAYVLWWAGTEIF